MICQSSYKYDFVKEQTLIQIFFSYGLILQFMVDMEGVLANNVDAIILCAHVSITSSLKQWFHAYTLYTSECPALPPSPGHLCVPPTGVLNCTYTAESLTVEQCCCGVCPQNFTVSCVLDSISGAGVWQSTLCPSEGCGSEGELL